MTPSSWVPYSLSYRVIFLLAYSLSCPMNLVFFSVQWNNFNRRGGWSVWHQPSLQPDDEGTYHMVWRCFVLWREFKTELPLPKYVVYKLIYCMKYGHYHLFSRQASKFQMAGSAYKRWNLRCHCAEYFPWSSNQLLSLCGFFGSPVKCFYLSQWITWGA